MADEAGRDVQRVDRWLWFARFVKTRALAQRLVAKGKVRVNRTRVTKSSQPVSPGDVVSLMNRDHIKVVEVLATGTRRGPAPEARLLYCEINPASDVAPGTLTHHVRTSTLDDQPRKCKFTGNPPDQGNS
ncbi:MAG: RNA-binding S4 domain-containing protein [Anderseniella sp.]